VNDDDELLARLGEAIDRPVPPVDPARVQAVRDAAAASSSPAAPLTPVAPLRSRRSVLGLGALAAGSAAAGIAVGVGLTSLLDDDPTPVPLQPVSDLETAAGVTASASLIDHTWGLEVLLDVEGLAPGTPYRMVFVDRDGAPVDAGGFVGTDGLMKCRNNGPILKADVARWVVTAPDGTEAVTARVV
jgi:hypothetical protein